MRMQVSLSRTINPDCNKCENYSVNYEPIEVMGLPRNRADRDCSVTLSDCPCVIKQIQLLEKKNLNWDLDFDVEED